MKNLLKQALSLLLFFILVLGVFPSSVLAARYGEGCYGKDKYGVGGNCVTANGSSSNGDSVSSDTPTPAQCSDQTPGGAPWLYGAVAQNSNSITLNFGSAADPIDHYALQFGTKSGDYSMGADNIGGKDLRTYTVQSLQPNTTYYFRIRGGNGCATGNWSNELSASTTGLVAFNQLSFTQSELTSVTSTSETTPSTDTCQTYTVQSGDSLWEIAASELGDGNLYKDIIEQNKDIYPSLTSSNSVTVGWELKLKCDLSTDQEKSKVGGYSVNVKVTDTKQQPVEGAKVAIHSTVQEATTDKDGIAKFSNVEPGDHRILIAYNNYEGEQSINLTGDAKEFTLNVTIQQKSVLTSPLVLGIVGGLTLVIAILGILLFRKRN